MISPKEADFVGNLENRKAKIYWENVFILGQTVKCGLEPRSHLLTSIKIDVAYHRWQWGF